MSVLCWTLSDVVLLGHASLMNWASFLTCLYIPIGGVLVVMACVMMLRWCTDCMILKYILVM